MQAELERSLSRVLSQDVRIALAGRTDAGVHATGQVIGFRAGTALDEAAIRRGVNALLPADIAIRQVEEAPETWHPRFSATGRKYEYRIRTGPHREPLERHREHWTDAALDLEAMVSAAAGLVGRRDFASFASGPLERGSVREVRRAELLREGTLVRFEIEADAFLRGMVRAIVGTLLWVGTGHTQPGDVGRILAARDRAAAGPSAPPQGLCLVAVDYAGRPGVASEDDDE